MSITVITVVRDDVEGLMRTARSLRTEIGEFLDWVVIDSSAEPIEKQLTDSISDFTYFFMPPKGIYAAMNLGAEKAKGEWLWFLNAGDEMITNYNHLTSAIQTFRDVNGVAFSVNLVKRNGEFLRVIKPFTKKNLLTKRTEFHANHQGFLFKRASLETNPYNLEYKFAADTNLIDSLANSGEIAICDMTIANFFINGRSAQHYRKVQKELDRIRPQKNTFGHLVSREWLYLKTILRRIIY